ncbi:hypothetical protein BKA66DRAFT_465638 [Pyrenochaeta sp. MPI-SDFR-AT-0127]|nr:hypothetical protein BKA66DRAFT_465638 [Pyrenochaeta sp. MPI-SDFR-AT-0127]
MSPNPFTPNGVTVSLVKDTPPVASAYSWLPPASTVHPLRRSQSGPPLTAESSKPSAEVQERFAVASVQSGIYCCAQYSSMVSVIV